MLGTRKLFCRVVRFCVALLPSIAMPLLAHAGSGDGRYLIRNITNGQPRHTVGDAQIDGTNITWTRKTLSVVPGGLHWGMDVYLYNGTNISNITNGAVWTNDNPKISGSNITWRGYDYDSLAAVYLFDGTSTKVISDQSMDSSWPQISGQNVVWTSWLEQPDDGNVYLYDGATTTKISDNELTHFPTDPQISGDYVTWRSHEDLFFYDGHDVVDITGDCEETSRQSMYGGNVVWGTMNHEICLYNGTSTTKLYTDRTGYIYPAIDGASVVTSGGEASGGGYHYDLTTKALTELPGIGVEPEISGSRIVSEGSNDQILLFDRGTVTQLSGDNTRSFSPEISGPNVTWISMDRETEIWDIYVAYWMGPDAMLENVDLSNEDLSGLDLSGTNLSGADFSNTSGWAEAIFEGAFYDPENVPEWANGMTPLEMGIIAGFPEPPGVSATDYNDDGIVDAADYTVWRDQMGPLVPPGYGADGDGDGYIGYKDYLLWKDAYGGVVTTASSNTHVPEPTTLLLVLISFFGTPLRRAV